MQLFTLKKHTDNSAVFSGYYQSFSRCLEDAVEKKTDLSYLDLRTKNLTNANLDGAHLPFTTFDGSNLTGCNLSESVLSGSSFENCSLYNTCFSYSNLSGCDFTSAQFGATMIEGCDLSNTIFSTLSCFDLDFFQSETMEGSKFKCPEGNIYGMSRVPMILKGLFHTPVIMMDDTMKIGCKYFPKNMGLMIIRYIEMALCNNRTDEISLLWQK